MQDYSQAEAGRKTRSSAGPLMEAGRHFDDDDMPEASEEEEEDDVLDDADDDDPEEVRDFLLCILCWLCIVMLSSFVVKFVHHMLFRSLSFAMGRTCHLQTHPFTISLCFYTFHWPR